MKEVVGIFLLILIHSNDGSVFVQGPSEPVLLGMEVTLECNSTDPGVDLEEFKLMMLRKRDGLWRAVPVFCLTNYRPPNWLHIGAMQPSWGVDYVCIPIDASEPDNSSQLMRLRWRELPTIVPQGVAARVLWRHRQWENLEVQQEEDVVMDCNIQYGTRNFYWSKEGEDWMVDSPQLRLSSVQASDGGLYRCTVEDPDEMFPSSSQTIRVSVLPEGSSWYQTTNGRIVIIAGGLAVALLVLIYTVGWFLFKAARRAKQAKGPIDDHSQKKPIYKGSAESIPASLNGDKQPLV